MFWMKNFTGLSELCVGRGGKESQMFSGFLSGATFKRLETLKISDLEENHSLALKLDL